MKNTNGLRRSDLRKIQKWGTRRIYNNEITILAWDMGSGKSVTALTAMDDLLEDGVVKKVLIVAPLLVSQVTIPDEIEEWEHLNHIDYTLIRAEDNDQCVIDAYEEGLKLAKSMGIPSTSDADKWANRKKSEASRAGESDLEELKRIRKRWFEVAKKLGISTENASRWAGKYKTRFKERRRRRLALSNSEVHIINKQALVWLWEFYDSGKNWPYDMLIFDEASMFKNGSRRTKTKSLSLFGAAAKARKYAKRIVLMTGTPAPKGLWNMWGILFIADLGERLGKSRTKFETRYFDKDYMGWNLTPKPNAFEQITSKASDIMFSLSDEDYPDLPPIIPVPIKVTLPKRVMEEYREFQRTFVSEIYDIEAVNSGVLVSKLLQFANGSMYNEDGNDVWVHDEKLDALVDIVERANGEPVLVSYSFKFDLKRIKKAFKKAVVFGEGDVRETKADWNAGRIDLMLAHPASVGHGQNIQFGGNINCWYGLTPDLELFQQFNKRLHRPGQKKPVTNYYITAKNTYDDRLLPLLSDRGSTQDHIMRQFVIDMKRGY